MTTTADEQLSDEDKARAEEEADFEAAYTSDDDSPAADDATGDDAGDDDEAGDQDGSDAQDVDKDEGDADGVQQQPDRLTELEKKVETQLRNINGHIGGLKSTLQKIQETAAVGAKTEISKTGADSPSKTQIADALKSGEKMTALKGEFPEWGEAMDEMMTALESRLEGVKPVDTDSLKESVLTEVKTSTEETLREYRELVKIDSKHPGWEDTVATEAFQQWMAAQPEDVQALAASDKAADAIKMMDVYQEHVQQNEQQQQQQQNQQQRQQQNKQRLESAVSPTGTKVKPSAKTEEQEFEEAYYSDD